MNVIQPMDPERLRDAAATNTLSAEQARAVAIVLTVLAVIHGDGTDVPEHLKARLLDRLLDAYRAELRRLGVPTEPGPRSGDAAAARRRAEAAARRAAETEAAGQAEDVPRLDDRRRSHRGPGETDPGA